jgi:hypothetical protein
VQVFPVIGRSRFWDYGNFAGAPSAAAAQNQPEAAS